MGTKKSSTWGILVSNSAMHAKGRVLNDSAEKSRNLPGASTRDVYPSMSPDGSGLQMMCPNCGASFSEDEPRCPYCGTLNPGGAEIEYLQELEDLKEDTDRLDDAIQGGLVASFRNNTKRVIGIVTIIVVAIVAIFVTHAILDKNDEQQELQSYQAREAFREQHFAELDRLYDSGDDAALSSYAWSLMDDPGFDALFTWKHIGYLEAYDDWEALKSCEEDAATGALSIDDYTWATSVAMHLAYPEVNARYQIGVLTKAEEARAAPYRAFAKQFLQNTLQMDEGEIESFIGECTDEYGDIVDDKLKGILTQRLRDLGVL